MLNRDIKEIIIGSVLTLSGALLMIGGDETIIIGAVIGVLGLALLFKLFASGYHGPSGQENFCLPEERENPSEESKPENKEEERNG